MAADVELDRGAMSAGQITGDGAAWPSGGRLVTAAAAMRSIRAGDKIFVGTGCGEPAGLLRALTELRPSPPDIEFISVFPTGSFDAAPATPRRQRNRVFIAAEPRDPGDAAMIDYVAMGLEDVPALFAKGDPPIDVAMVQVSVPDAHGYVSLGISVDLAPAAIRQARRVIAEVNPAMPRSYGDSLIHIDRFDMLVEASHGLHEFNQPAGSESAVHIAAYIASIIEDGSTLQIGLGPVPDLVLRLLGDRRDLGIHTDLLTDGVIGLLRAGAIAKPSPGSGIKPIVASYSLGTRQLFDLVDGNPLFHFQPLEQVCSPGTLAQIGRFVSISQARAVDLAGQVCNDHLTGAAAGGPSTQAAFLHAAARSPGGKPIVCLPSLGKDGESAIKPLLAAGEAVGIARADVHYVVTEFGIAYLFGRSVAERALALIGVAHPDHRATLLDAAKQHGCVARSQTFASRRDYAVQAERSVTVKNGLRILLRPARPTDAAAMRRLFHMLTADDVYLRFSQRMTRLTDSALASLCNVDEESDIAYVATVGPRENETVIGSGCYFLNPKTGLAEVAFVIPAEWQGSGIGSALQQRLREHAIGAGVKGFVAEVLPQNERMLRLAKSGAGRTEIVHDEDGVTVRTWFAATES